MKDFEWFGALVVNRRWERVIKTTICPFKDVRFLCRGEWWVGGITLLLGEGRGTGCWYPQGIRNEEFIEGNMSLRRPVNDVKVRWYIYKLNKKNAFGAFRISFFFSCFMCVCFFLLHGIQTIGESCIFIRKGGCSLYSLMLSIFEVEKGSHSSAK